MLPRRRILTLLALALAVVTLAVSPRGLFARPAQVPRWHTSKRPHAPRHVLPQGTLDVARRTGDVRRTRAELDRLIVEARVESSTMLLGSPLPCAAAMELAKPRYLRLHEGPHLQTSPPA